MEALDQHLQRVNAAAQPPHEKATFGACTRDPAAKVREESPIPVGLLDRSDGSWHRSRQGGSRCDG